jgi:hypothetical protein
MSDTSLSTLESDILALVERDGISLVLDALLRLASGENIAAVVDAVEKRAIRLAADAEAAEVLK